LTNAGFNCPDRPPDGQLIPEIHNKGVYYRLTPQFMDIRVSNISRNLIDSDIRKMFSAFGVINSAEVVRDKLNGRSKCNAVVNMPVESEGRQAIASLDQSLMDGKRISVIEFYPTRQW
jgi:hypothetical protein